MNKATQAVRDARAVAKAGGERYVRKAGGEKSVNARTQARRIQIAKGRAATRAAQPGATTQPGAPTVEAPDPQRGGTDWQKEAAAWVPGSSPINPAFDITNTDAQYKADAATPYRDETGTLGWRQIANNLRAQIVKAMAAGKTQLVLPDGEKWAAHQSTLDMIDNNLARPD